MNTEKQWFVVERHDGATSCTQLPAKDAFRLFCKIIAAGGSAVCKNFVGGVK
jgi:hypothetical protein